MSRRFVIPLIIIMLAVASLAAVAAGASRKVTRLQSSAVSQLQSGPEIPGNNCGDLLNSLFAAAGWR